MTLKDTIFVLIHGSWHGGWAWHFVQDELLKQGYVSIAPDLPQSGFKASLPASHQQLDFDMDKFIQEPSATAKITMQDLTDCTLQAIDQAWALDPKQVVVVGHSMGGMPLSFAGCAAPEKISKLVYLAAITPTAQRSAMDYLKLEAQQQDSLLSSLYLGNPKKIGALRINPRWFDAEYQAKIKQALAADIDDQSWSNMVERLTPDAPASIYREQPVFSDAFHLIPNHHVICSHDQALVPALGQAIYDDMAQSAHDICLHSLTSAHEPMLSMPAQLASLFIDIAEG
ncbi:MAG: alpha/beta hydrolase [Alphaproteobacteria bacterium]